MVRNLEKEINGIKEQLKQLEEKIEIQSPVSMVPKGEGPARAAKLQQKAELAGNKGAVEYYGVFQSGDRGYLRHQEYIPIEDLLKLDVENVAKILFSLGNRQRLAMLKTILDNPVTANELVELHGLGTTGEAYHHLKALQAADFIKQEDGGRYAFRPHRVHGFVMILAGVNDILDQKYTAGDLSHLVESDQRPGSEKNKQK